MTELASISNVCPLLYALLNRSGAEIAMEYLNNSGQDDVHDRVSRLIDFVRDLMVSLHEHGRDLMVATFSDYEADRVSEGTFDLEDVGQFITMAYGEMSKLSALFRLGELDGTDLEEMGHRAGKLARICVESGANTEVEIQTLLELFFSIELKAQKGIDEKAN